MGQVSLADVNRLLAAAEERHRAIVAALEIRLEQQARGAPAAQPVQAVTPVQPVQLGAALQPDQAAPAVVLMAPHVPAMQPAPSQQVPPAAHLGVGVCWHLPPSRAIGQLSAPLHEGE